MTLKDLQGAFSSVKHHRKPALRPAGRACQGRRAHTTVRQLFLCGFPSLLHPGGPAGVGVAVLKSVQGWSLPPAGPGPHRSWAKQAVGPWFLPRRCADLWSVAAGLSTASRLAWHACSCRARGGEAEGQRCSGGGGLGRDGLAQHLTPGAAAGAQGQPSITSPGCRHCAYRLSSFLYCFSGPCAFTRISSPLTWGLGCLDTLNYIFFTPLGWMAFHLQGRAMPCLFWPTGAPDI